MTQQEDINKKTNKKVLNDSKVILKSKKSGRTLLIIVSTKHGRNRFKKMIGMEVGQVITTADNDWIIIDIMPYEHKKKKHKKRKKIKIKSALMTHPLNNSTHFIS